MYYFSDGFLMPSDGDFYNVKLFNENYNLLSILQPKNDYGNLKTLVDSHERLYMYTRQYGVLPEILDMNSKFSRFLNVLFTLESEIKDMSYFKKNLKKFNEEIQYESSSGYVVDDEFSQLAFKTASLDQTLEAMGYIRIDEIKRISITNGKSDENKDIDSKKLVEDCVWNFRLLEFNKSKIETEQDDFLFEVTFHNYYDATSEVLSVVSDTEYISNGYEYTTVNKKIDLKFFEELF